jgi:hypothetical protein
MRKLGLGRAIPRKEIHKWDFPCSVSSASQVLQVVDQQLHRRSLFHIAYTLIIFVLFLDTDFRHSTSVSHVLLRIADTLINCVSFLFPNCRHSHQLCLIACSGLQTLSSTVSHFLFRIADTLINCVSFLVPDCRHSRQLCLISYSILHTLSSIVSHFLFRIADTLITCVLLLVPYYSMLFSGMQTLTSTASMSSYKLQTRTSESYWTCSKFQTTQASRKFCLNVYFIMHIGCNDVPNIQFCSSILSVKYLPTINIDF